ncbi:MAG TPA: hypothetical protein VFS33_09235 [Gemmatimonadales bacterium]|nr:hypothetical protein [Gemmatimonadales bacterium]
MRLLLLLPLLVSCYTYRPLETPAPAAGSRVAVRLTSQGENELADELGIGITTVIGDVIAVDSAGLGIAVREVEDARRVSTDWKGERITIPRSFIADMQARQLSVPATGLLGGAIVGGLVAAYAAFGGSGSSSGSNPAGTAPGGAH